MAGPRALRRLLRVREIEEEHRRRELEAAMDELRRLERALAAAGERDRGGRLMIAQSATSGEVLDRLAGLEESLAAQRSAGFLGPRTVRGQQEVARLREDFLAKRVGRRQAEHMLESMEARRAIETARRGQQTLDEGHLSQMRRQGAAREREALRRDSRSGEAGALEKKT